MSKTHLGAALLVSAVVVACSTSSQSNDGRIGQTTQNIQGGTDDGTDHPFVVGIQGTTSDGILTCSGALVLPNMVLTARHCVEQPSSDTIDCTSTTFGGPYIGATLAQEAPSYFVTTNSTIQGAPKATKHAISQIITPTPTMVCGNDLAILILTDVIDASEATPAIPETGFDLSDRTQYDPNSGFTAIGYGITSPSGTDSGTRRILQNIPTECIPQDPLIDCTAEGAPAGVVANNEFIGGDGPCEGDSGSSAWEQDHFSKGVFISMGVLSRGGQSADGTKCQESIYTRLDAWRDLIVATAQTASANWTTYPKPVPDWTVYTAPPANDGVPEGGTSEVDATPGTKGTGDACTSSKQCISDICISVNGGTTYFCSADCTSTACPANYTCNGSHHCIPGATPTPTPDDDAGSVASTAPSATPETTTTTTSGCSVAPVGSHDPSKPVPWKGLAIAAVAMGFAFVQRRRRNS